jgi:hypothetical protein
LLLLLLLLLLSSSSSSSSSPSFKLRHSVHFFIWLDIPDYQWPLSQYLSKKDADHHHHESFLFYSMLNKPRLCQLEDRLCLVQMSYLPFKLSVFVNYPNEYSKHTSCYANVCHISLLSHRSVLNTQIYEAMGTHGKGLIILFSFIFCRVSFCNNIRCGTLSPALQPSE